MGSDQCEYSVAVECDPESAPTVVNAWMVFCNTVRDVDGAEITDARADPAGLERTSQDGDRNLSDAGDHHE